MWRACAVIAIVCWAVCPASTAPAGMLVLRFADDGASTTTSPAPSTATREVPPVSKCYTADGRPFVASEKLWKDALCSDADDGKLVCITNDCFWWCDVVLS